MFRINKKILIIVLVVLTILTVLFIFSRSLSGMEESAKESNKVQEIVEPILEPVVGEGNVTDHLVRKLAHVTEFMVLGVELSALSLLIGKHSVGYTVLAAVSTALCDETIQLFSKRGSQVQDIWLDISGAILGAILVLLARYLYKLIIHIVKKNKKTKDL